MKPHKWAKEIKAWADGAEIEYKSIHDDDDWELDDQPYWDERDFIYRIKPQPKEPKYGEIITGRVVSNTWLEEHEARISSLERLIKPQPKEQQYLYVYQMGGKMELAPIKRDTLNFVCGDREYPFNYVGKIKLENDNG